jgi:NAD(P)-dependent dehydrogenase (short-subunit alcohol dehydrogenase family)
MPTLQGKVAVITGGSSGIGLATAKRFAQEGARVYIVGRRLAELESAVATIGERAEAIQCDVTVPADLDRLFTTVKSKAGQLDVLVASSGTSEYALLGSMTEEHFDKLFDLNVRGLVFTVQRGLELMNAGSSIVVIGSIAGSVGNVGYGTYSATKAAVRSYVRTWSKELAGRNIRVNAVSPGPTDTPLFAEASDEVRRHLTSLIPMNRLGEPEEVANAALFFASSESSYVTGAELLVDGGMIA